MPLYAWFTGALVMAGIVLLVVAFRPAPPKQPRRNTGPTLTQKWAMVSRNTKTRIVVGLALGVLAAAFSGIILLIVVVPAAIIGLPLLLGRPNTRERDLLSELETWSRSLAAAAETGNFTLRQVIEVTQGSAPPLLRVAVDRLSTRMKGAWSNADALREFAGELNSAHVDEVVIYLIQAAEYNSGGVTRALEDVAQMLSDQVKLQLETAIEREKPRRALVTMTGIIGVVLAGIILLSHTPQVAPYRTPVGEGILAGILASFVLLLIWAKSQSTVKPDARIVLSSSTRGDES